jgi:G3E family GTPase
MKPAMSTTLVADSTPSIPSVTVHLLTGALGSGKTTFLRHLLERHLFGEPVAVIVNDFGDVVYDALVLRQAQHVGQSSPMIIDVPGGCLCCSAVDDFKEALSSIVSRGYKRIFIEATGLADAEQVRSDVAFMGFPVESTLCVVDMLNYAYVRRIMSVVDAQIAAANILLFSKTDSASEEQLRANHRLVRALNPHAAIVYLRQGKAPTDFLITAFAPTEHFIAEHHTHQQHLLHDEVTAFRVSFGASLGVSGMLDMSSRALHHTTSAITNTAFCTGIEYQTLEQALNRLPDTVLRAKGIVWLRDHDHQHGKQASAEFDHKTSTAQAFLLNYVCGHAELIPLEGLHEAARLSFNSSSLNGSSHVPQQLGISQLFVIGRNVPREDILACFDGINNLSVESGTVRSQGVLEHHHEATREPL